MPEQLEPEVMEAGSEDRRSLPEWYAQSARPWMRRQLAAPWRAGIVLLIAVALGATGGGWVMDSEL